LTIGHSVIGHSLEISAPPEADGSAWGWRL